MTARSGAGAKRRVLPIVIILAVLVGGATYAVSTYRAGIPSCSGYPPGGDCPGEYSEAFDVSVNYTGQWRLTYYGYSSVGVDVFGTAGNYTGGTYLGTGPVIQVVSLTGPNTNGLTLCVSAVKLGSSNATLWLGIANQSNETSIPVARPVSARR